MIQFRPRSPLPHGARRPATLAAMAIGLALFQAATVAPPATAQTVADENPAAGDLNLPQGVRLFGASDPNVRRATAVVNGDIITGTDVDQRLALVLSANRQAVPEDEKQRLRLQILRNLIDETLQIQEAAANEIEIPEADVQQTFARVAEQNFNGDVAALERHLASIGSSGSSLKRQIRGELAWSRLLRRNVQPFINVSEDEVRDVLARLEAAKGTQEYRIGEIFLSATLENRAAVEENGRRIMEQLRQGGSFVAYARQFSEASTAAVGGDLGWIRLAQLPISLAEAARQLQPGQLVGPIEAPGGFSILYMIDQRQVLTSDPRDAVLSLKQVSLAFAPGTGEAAATRRASEFASATRAIKGCGEVEPVAQRLGATVVANDQVRVRDLPGPLQETMLALAIGEATPPFGAVDEGVRVLVLCGRDDPQAAGGPDFETMMASMEEERVNKRAQIYLRDLRRDAVIDYN